MKMKDLLLLGVIGIGAYLLFKSKNIWATGGNGTPTTTTPNGTTEKKPDVLDKGTTTTQPVFTSAAQAIAASVQPAITAKTIEIAGSYAVTPTSTYRAPIIARTAAQEAARKAAWL